MKLNNDSNNGLLENTFKTQSQAFKINACSQAFKILTDNLYEYKIPTIIRELSCNAWDAQVLAGNKDIPFEIHLPDNLEPYFSIRDFGTGLSKEDLLTIYTTYFESTKADSNEFIGAFGLGSKTPLCYTEQFTVTSFFEGQKMLFNVHMNQGGFPEIQEIATVPSDEPNGLKVEIPVATKDIKEFETSVLKFYQPLSINPKILNYPSDDYKKSLEEGIIEESRYGDLVRYQKNKDCNSFPLGFSAYAKLGLVLYKFDADRVLNSFVLTNFISNPKSRIKICKKLGITEITYLDIVKKYDLVHQSSYFLSEVAGKYDSFIVLNFPIGSLSVQASRERLSYDEETQFNFVTSYLASLFSILIEMDREITNANEIAEYIAVKMKYKELGLNPPSKRISNIFSYNNVQNRIEFDCGEIIKSYKLIEKQILPEGTKIKLFMMATGYNSVRDFSECPKFEVRISLNKCLEKDDNGKPKLKPIFTIYVGNISYVDFSFFEYANTNGTNYVSYIKLDAKANLDEIIEKMRNELPPFIDIRKVEKTQVSRKKEPSVRVNTANRIRIYNVGKEVNPKNFFSGSDEEFLTENLIKEMRDSNIDCIYYYTFNKLNSEKRNRIFSILYYMKNVKRIYEIKKFQIEKLKKEGFNLVNILDDSLFDYESLSKVLEMKVFLYSFAYKKLKPMVEDVCYYTDDSTKRAMDAFIKKIQKWNYAYFSNLWGNSGERAKDRILGFRMKFVDKLETTISKKKIFEFLFSFSTNYYCLNAPTKDFIKENDLIKEKIYNILTGEDYKDVNNDCNQNIEGEQIDDK